MNKYKHYRTGNLYTIIGETKYKHEGIWYDAIMYQGDLDERIWVRPVDNFYKCFQEVEG